MTGDRLTASQLGLRSPNPDKDIYTLERCFVQQLEGSDEPGGLSIARARVEPGVTTQLHLLRDTDERYLIIRGEGRVMVAGKSFDVRAGDVVVIPANVPQRVKNTGTEDLEFFCVCVPPFESGCYEPLD